MTHIYYADLEVTYGDGATGAKRFEGLTLAGVQRQADKKLAEMIATSKFAKQMDADKTFQIASHKISSGKMDV
jgi:hypothetical protein